MNIKLLWTEAKTKVTTWVALAIAGIAQLAEHAEEIVNEAPALKAYLPATKSLDTAAHYVLSALGLLVIYTRVRRKLHGTPDPAAG